MSTLREVSGPGHFPRFLHLNGVSVYVAAFPESVSTKQQYRLLGNSLNVVVVAKLLQLLVSPELEHKDGGHR